LAVKVAGMIFTSSIAPCPAAAPAPMVTWWPVTQQMVSTEMFLVKKYSSAMVGTALSLALVPVTAPLETSPAASLLTLVTWPLAERRCPAP
jgi:hypothetical protein